MSEIVSGGAQPMVGEIQNKLLEPFITATCAALGEMAGIEVVVRAVYQEPVQQTSSDIVAVLGFLSASEGFLLFCFPRQTAAALAGRILAGMTEEVDENLIRDCVGEIANVVAGQAKTLLASTPYRFALSLPKIIVGGGTEFRPKQSMDCLVVAFSSDQGEFTMQLVLER